MQYRLSTLAVLGLAGKALGAYVPSEPWTTLTPKAAAPTGAITDYSASFGIAVLPITTGVSSSATLNKRDAVVTQIGDGQIQAATTTTSTTVAKTTAKVVTQIGDGQIQADTTTATTAKTTAKVVTQIGDGQIQAATTTATTATPVTQIGDGQIQAASSTAAAATQIGDGQIQATNSTESALEDENVSAVACSSSGTLAMELKSSILTDSAGRIGSIVANRQFQFDGPPPQAGAIYAAGWSITAGGNLAIGDNDIFYQCLSGTFYNLYDESLGAQCTPVYLEVVELIDC